MVFMLGAAFVLALVVSVVACALGLGLFPWFRSGERKEDAYRAGQSTGGYTIERRRRGKRHTLRVSTSELPLVGGPAMLLAVLVAGGVLGVRLGMNYDQWVLLGILLVAMLGYGLVGFVDDALKYRRGSGISELQKFAGVGAVSLGAAVALNRLIVSGRLSARFAYPPYSDVPALGSLLQHVHFAWIVFFLLMTATVATSTSLSSDFSDGIDGLCGGLLLSASLAFAVILFNDGQADVYPLILVSLGVAGAALGYLPFNWPSSWKPRGQGHGKRRARLIMGDTGSLALGGVLALVAVMSRLELLLIIIGGVFLLEGVSALISARILVRFFRRFLVVERFKSSRGFSHSEFPLPFLGTPMHHHFDLLNWDRKRLVYGAWLLGALLGLLGVASVIGQFTWQRYLARLVGLGVVVSVWQLGPRTRSFFIGLTNGRSPKSQQAGHLALCYGYPFKLFGRRLFGYIDMTKIAPDALATPGEQLSLWQRMSVFDARALLGYYCYRAGDDADAYRIWDRIPDANLKLRPEIAELLAEVRHRLALDQEDELGDEATAERPKLAMDGAVSAATDDPARGQWRMAAPPSPASTAPASTLPAGAAPGLQPTDAGAPQPPDAPDAPENGTPLWTPGTWSVASSGIFPAVPEDGAPRGEH